MTGVHVDVAIRLLDIDPKFQENITSTHSIRKNVARKPLISFQIKGLRLKDSLRLVTVSFFWGRPITMIQFSKV